MGLGLKLGLLGMLSVSLFSYAADDATAALEAIKGVHAIRTFQDEPISDGATLEFVLDGEKAGYVVVGNAAEEVPSADRVRPVGETKIFKEENVIRMEWHDPNAAETKILASIDATAADQITVDAQVCTESSCRFESYVVAK